MPPPSTSMRTTPAPKPDAPPVTRPTDPATCTLAITSAAEAADRLERLLVAGPAGVAHPQHHPLGAGARRPVLDVGDDVRAGPVEEASGREALEGERLAVADLVDPGFEHLPVHANVVVQAVHGESVGAPPSLAVGAGFADERLTEHPDARRYTDLGARMRIAPGQYGDGVHVALRIAQPQVAPARCALEAGAAVGADPHLGAASARRRQRGGQIDLEESAAVGERLTLEAPGEHVEQLVGAGRPAVAVDAVGGEVRRLVADADAEHGAAAARPVEHGVLLGEAHRVVQWPAQHQRGEANSSRGGEQLGTEDHRRHQHRRARLVELGQADELEPGLLGGDHLGHQLVPQLGQVDHRRLDRQYEPEPHAPARPPIAVAAAVRPAR